MDLNYTHYPESVATVIAKEDDFSDWDGNSPVLLRLTTKRGEEGTLLEIAERLSSFSGPVYVDFGLLSHPAMVLREYGVDMIPSYLLKSISENDSSYEKISADIDVGYDPYIRIQGEEQLVISNDYYVVRDKDPICSNHLLILSKRKVPSLADDPGAFGLPSLFEDISKKEDVGEFLFLKEDVLAFVLVGLLVAMLMDI